MLIRCSLPITLATTVLEKCKYVEREEKEKHYSLSIMKRGRTGEMRMERNSLMRVACHATRCPGEFQTLVAAEGNIWAHGHAAM